MSPDPIPPDDPVQRREDVRVHARLPVELSARVVSLTQFRSEGHEATVISGETTSISGGGFSLLCREAIPPGTSFNVRLLLPECLRPLTMKARVVRCKLDDEHSESPVYDLGLIFTRITEAVRSHIVSYVFSVQRMAVTEMHNE